jgi:hypothetical protein
MRPLGHNSDQEDIVESSFGNARSQSRSKKGSRSGRVGVRATTNKHPRHAARQPETPLPPQWQGQPQTMSQYGQPVLPQETDEWSRHEASNAQHNTADPPALVHPTDAPEYCHWRNIPTIQMTTNPNMLLVPTQNDGGQFDAPTWNETAYNIGYLNDMYVGEGYEEVISVINIL